MQRVELLDTSILLELIGVPYESDNLDEIRDGLDERAELGVVLQLSVAAVIEAGDHVGRIDEGTARRECAIRLQKLMLATLADEAPWRFRPVDWDEDLLTAVLAPTDDRAPQFVESLAVKHLEMGDMFIVAEFQRLRENLDTAFVDIDVWTTDTALRGIIDYFRAGGATRKRRGGASK